MKYPIIRPVSQLYRPAASLRICPRSAGNYRQECNYVYAEAHGFGLVMDIFTPLTSPNGLGIVDVVSGAWFSDRVVLNEHIGLGVYDVLCAHGYTVFALSPGSVTKCTGLDMVRHVHAGIRHIKARSKDFSIDASRLALAGASAGGHLAALAALNPRPAHARSQDIFRQQDTTVPGVGLFFPPTDLVDYGGKPFDFMHVEGLRLDTLLFEDGIQQRIQPFFKIGVRPCASGLQRGQGFDFAPVFIGAFTGRESRREAVTASIGQANVKPDSFVSLIKSVHGFSPG